MDRRSFVKTAALGAATAAAACAKPAENQGPAVHTQEKVTWRLASSFPRSLDTIFGAAEFLSRRLDEMSDGAFQLRAYPAGEIVPALEVMDAVQVGTIQVGHTASYYATGKNPALAFDACVPFGLTSRQQAAWLQEGGGLELMRAVYADFSIINFPAGNTGAQMGGWFRREVGSLADLQGLKMRIPGLGGEVMDRMGAAVQVLSGAEIYPALERGALDATEWVGPYDDEKLGFHKIAPFYYYPGWWEPGPSLTYQVHRPAWDRLSKSFQAMFQAAAAESAALLQQRYDQRNPAALQRLLAGGTQLRRFSDDLLQAALDTTRALLAEKSAGNPGYAKIYESWSKARGEAFKWFGANELAYENFAFLRP